MRQFYSTIISQKLLAPEYYEMRFSWDKGEEPQPGQFFTLAGWPGSDPLLRRPFAFSGYDPVPREASMIYQLRGKATGYLTRLKEGMELNFLGPLGNVFPVKQKTSIIVGGGIGTGPVVYFANHLSRMGIKPLLVLGYRTASMIPELHLEPDVELILTTDDGTSGFQGTVVDYLKTTEVSDGVLYSCGPYPMLKACHQWALEKDLPSYVSMEEIMACGIGACQGCAVEVTLPQKYLRVCKEGPIFDSRIIQWT